jgi:hypothetical protein
VKPILPTKSRGVMVRLPRVSCLPMHPLRSCCDFRSGSFHGPFCTTSGGGVAIQQSRDLGGNLVGRHDKCTVQMYVALGDASRRMTEQSRYRQFGEPEVASDAREGMAKHMGRHVIEFRLRANAVEDADNPNEVSVSPVCGKDEG